MPDLYCAAAELKFTHAVADAPFEGVVEGIGSVFNAQDQHGDLILPGAFAETLADYKARGAKMPMYAEHSRWLPGGDLLPVGVWDEIEETSHGLAVKGRLVGLDHPDVKRVGDLLKNQVMKGLSIAFVTPEGGAIHGKSKSEPRRTLKRLGLLSIDVVADAAQTQARVTTLKSMAGLSDELASLKALTIQGDQQSATAAVTKAIRLHMDSLSGGNSPTSEQRADLLAQLQSAHKALTGQAMPPGLKHSATTIREFERGLADGFGLSNSKARAIADLVFKTDLLRDEAVGTKAAVPREALQEITQRFQGFSLPLL